MATNTYVALRTTTVSSTTPSVTIDLTGISGYTDLVLVMSGTTGSLTDSYCRVNGDTGSNYSYTRLYGTGTVTGSDRLQNQTELKAGDFGTSLNSHIVHFMDYANTTTNKTILFDTKNPSSSVIGMVGLWRSTSAITSITLFVSGTNFAVGSTFSLYGITAASSTSPKATGGTIYEDSTYWYHAFGATGTFTPNQALTCDYLVVAGGGGGSGSGGGAGGLRSTVTATGGGGSLETALSLSASAYTITVGAGGAGGNGQSAFGSDGVSSSIAGAGITTVSTVGGGGGAWQLTMSTPGRTGGSGSGAFSGGGSPNTGSNVGGAGTANQGYAGGNSFYEINSSSTGGGGGAGGVGQSAAAANIGGNGGNGVTVAMLGPSTTYAGGGGGGIYINGVAGIGGTGGGGKGASNNAAGSFGGANTGGGGGGAYSEPYKTAAYAGGSGIVILRYLKA
jgi:hypothetical protein